MAKPIFRLMNLPTSSIQLLFAFSLLCTATLSAQTAQSLTDVANGMTAAEPSPAPQIKEFGTCTFYNDLEEFQTACGVFPIEGFESAGVGPGGVTSCNQPVNSLSSNCFNIGDLIPGFTLTAPGGIPGNEILVTGDAFLGLPAINTTMIGANEFPTALEITFDALDVTAVSFDLTTAVVQGEVQIDLYDLSNAVMATSMVNTTGADPVFFATSVTDPISKVVINSTLDQAELIDNLTFGACTVIPAMGQWALMILGLILASIGVVFLYGKNRNTILA